MEAFENEKCRKIDFYYVKSYCKLLKINYLKIF